MIKETPPPPPHGSADAPVAFGQRLASSADFWTLFHDGMGLVEETASYLDGMGKSESKTLSRVASVLFGTESMRLTTRLMQLASWLLLQRAINEGSISAARGDSERTKVTLGALSSATSGTVWSELPATLRQLIERSIRLQDRVMILDRSLRTDLEQGNQDNPVAQALDRLSAAFER
jgi:regulator of CtrA degradation